MSPRLVLWSATATAVALASAPAFGQVTFSDPVRFDTAQSAHSVRAADFDDDGRVDLAVASGSQGLVGVYRGLGGGAFSAPAFVTVPGRPRDLRVGDVNEDGDEDLIIARDDGTGGTVVGLVFLAGGAGATFTGAGSLAVAGSAGMNLADVNGDGDPDVVVPSAAAGTLRVLLGGPGAAFVSQPAVPSGASPRAVASVDLDGDADDDLVVANGTEGQVTVLLSDGDGGFQPGVSYAVGAAPRAIATGDVNGDGHGDVAVAGELSNDVTVLLGAGDGTLGSATSVAVGLGPRSVDLRDMDGDGALDLTVAEDSEGSVSILLGDGQGAFGPRATTPLFTDPFQIGPWLSLGVADLDSDAAPDLIVANERTLSGNGGIDGLSALLNLSDFHDPVAVDDAYTTAEDEPLVVAAPGLLSNDSDADGDHLVVAEADAPAHGQVETEPDGSFVYTPDQDFVGDDSFSYWIHDNRGRISSWATVRITVTAGGDDPPAAGDDTFQVRRGGSLEVAAPGVLANDSDPDADPLFAELVTAPDDAQVSLAPDGSFNFLSLRAGTHTFTYRVYDGDPGAEGPTPDVSDDATVTVEVLPNDPPVAVDDQVEAAEGVPLEIPAASLLANDTDPDGDPLFSNGISAGPATHGSVTYGDGPTLPIIYTPDPGYSGPDSFEYSIYDGIFTATARVHVTVTPAAPRLTLGDASVVERGPGETATLRIPATLSAPAPGDVTFRWSTADGTATAPDDYTARLNRLATIKAGTTGTTLSIPVAGDALDEDDETVAVTAGSLVGALADDTAATGTIQDDDPAPSVSIGDVSIAEGNAGTRNAVFPVTLSAPALRNVRVGWSTLDGTATAGSDYAARLNRFVTFLPGETAKTVAVPVIGDAVEEDDETFAVALIPGTYGTIADGEGIATIVDEDFPEPTISVGDVTVVEGNTGSKSAVLTVTLSNQSTRRVDVGWSTQDGTAEAGSDYTARLAQTLAFSAGQTSRTISVPILGDRVTESTEDLTVQLAGTGYGTLADGEGAITITDND